MLELAQVCPLAIESDARWLRQPAAQPWPETGHDGRHRAPVPSG